MANMRTLEQQTGDGQNAPPIPGQTIDGYIFVPNPNGIGGVLVDENNRVIGPYDPNTGHLQTTTGETQSSAPPAAPAKASMADFQLPWYPATYTGQQGSYINLSQQLNDAQIGHHDYSHSDFGRTHFSHGLPYQQADTPGKAPWNAYPIAPGSPPGGPVQPQPIPFPQPAPAPTPYVPPPSNPPPAPSGPPPPGTNPLPILGSGGNHLPQVNPMPLPRTGTPGGGLLTPGPVNPLLRGGNPMGGIDPSLLGHPSLPSAGPPNPLLRGSTPSGLLGAPQVTAPPTPNRMNAMGVRSGADTPSAASPNNAGMYGTTSPSNDIAGFRFQNTQDPYALNFNYLAQSQSPAAAGQYFNTVRNQLSPSLYNQTANQPGFAQQFINTAGAGGTGSQYAGGGLSMDGSKAWTGAIGGQAPGPGYHPMGFNMYATDLPYQTDPYGLAGTPLAGLLGKYAPQIAAAMAAAGKSGTPS